MIKECTLSTNGRVENLAEWIENHADNRHAVNGKADRDAGMRKAMHEINRAINGVDNEGRGIGQGLSWVIGLLSMKSTRVVSLGMTFISCHNWDE